MLKDAKTVYEIETPEPERNAIDVPLHHIEHRVRAQIQSTGFHGGRIVQGHNPCPESECNFRETPCAASNVKNRYPSKVIGGQPCVSQ
jgi:hypothetical protein